MISDEEIIAVRLRLKEKGAAHIGFDTHVVYPALTRVYGDGLERLIVSIPKRGCLAIAPGRHGYRFDPFEMIVLGAMSMPDATALAQLLNLLFNLDSGSQREPDVGQQPMTEASRLLSALKPKTEKFYARESSDTDADTRRTGNDTAPDTR